MVAKGKNKIESAAMDKYNNIAKQTDYIAYPFDVEHKKAMVKALMSTGEMQKDINTWCIGLLTITFTGVIAFRWPTYYWLFHTLKMFYYFGYRYFDFKKKNEEFYMLEFCYCVTYMVSIWCIWQAARSMAGATDFSDGNTGAIRAGFAFANGGLAWSILCFRNSIVLHDRGQLSSTFIHISPAIMGWCLRWNALLPHQWINEDFPNMFNVCPGADPVAVDECNKFWCNTVCTPGTIADFIWMPVASYAVWMVAHALIFQGFFASYFVKNNKTHLFTYMRENPDPLMKALWGVTDKIGIPDWVVYYCTHFSVNVILGCLSWVYWQSFVLHTAWMLLLTFTAAYNGASYTFKVFAVRYAPQKFRQLGFEGVALGTQENAIKSMKQRKLGEILKKARAHGKVAPEDESTLNTSHGSAGIAAGEIASN